jgi:hypothetical protein
MRHIISKGDLIFVGKSSINYWISGKVMVLITSGGLRPTAAVPVP